MTTKDFMEVQKYKTRNFLVFCLPNLEGEYEIVRSQDNFEMKELLYPNSLYRGLTNYETINLGTESYKIEKILNYE